MTQTKLDPLEFRRALGAYTTGVTIVTACGSDGALAGVTANSFSSVSLDPPLVLWSLAKSAYSLPIFESTDYFAIHILAAGQVELSNRFASKGEDKFGGVAYESGIGGAPLLPGAATRFQCKVKHRYDGGDHIIYVGEVLDLVSRDEMPLAYHGGKYALPARKNLRKLVEGSTSKEFSDDHLGYLLWRAWFHFSAALQANTVVAEFTDHEFMVLMTLFYGGARSAEALAFKSLPHGPEQRASLTSLENLVSKGLACAKADEQGRERYALTDVGRAKALSAGVAAMSVEADFLERVGPREGLVLKDLLKHLILETGGGFPFPLHPGESET